MRLSSIAIAMLTCVALALSAFADEKSSEVARPRNYAEAAEECEKAIEQRKHELASQYSSDVWTLKERFQKAGDLENALLADKEWSRSLSRKPLTQEHLVESPAELANLQRDYVDRFASVVETVATEFLQDLKKEASDLAKAGKLADGKVLQQDIDTIKRLYLGGRDGKPRASGAAGGKAEGDVIAACEEAIRQKRVAMQAHYVGELEALEKSFQAKGLLEDLFAAKAERTRFLDTPLLAKENLVEQPDALRELQQKYLELQQNVTASAAEEFVAKLEQQKQALTIEGKLEDAMQAKENAARIRARWLEGGSDDSVGSGLPLNVPVKGLLGWWPLDGNGKDVSRNSRNGVVHNAQPAVDRFGRRDRAMAFDGRSAYVEIPDDGKLALRDAFTVAVWFRCANTTKPTQCLVGKGAEGWGGTSKNSSFNMLIFSPYSKSLCACVMDGGGDFSAKINDGVAADWSRVSGEWVHAVSSYNGSRMTLFINGKQVDQKSLVFTLRNKGVPIYLAQEAEGLGRFFEGSLDEVGVWSRPLTEEEVRRLYDEKHQRNH